ncbi:MAG TPA: hypothetical protein VJB65_03150, partial [Patescibacteria group bacterium]|nr:hypothetical protein [Patescibacteria group bacterium]
TVEVRVNQNTYQSHNVGDRYGGNSNVRPHGFLGFSVSRETRTVAGKKEDAIHFSRTAGGEWRKIPPAEFSRLNQFCPVQNE